MRHLAKLMSRNAAHSKNHAGVLNVAIRIKEFGADGTYVRTHDVGNHLPKPVGMRYFYVVVEKG